MFISLDSSVTGLVLVKLGISKWKMVKVTTVLNECTLVVEKELIVTKTVAALVMLNGKLIAERKYAR